MPFKIALVAPSPFKDNVSKLKYSKFGIIKVIK
jgi:hypothetical protein